MNFLFILDFYLQNGLYQSKHEYPEKFNHLLFFAGLNQINIEHIHAYCDKRKSDGVKNATINRELTIARSAINYYNKHHDANVKNPFNGFKLFEEDFIPTYLTKADCQRLIQACKRYGNEVFTAYIALLIYTGCRAGELITLQWENVFLDDGYLIIRNSLSKNKKTVYKPLNSQAVQILQALKDSKLSSEWVFVNVNTATHYKNFRKPWANVLQMSNLNIRLHDLRHTFASLLVQQGVPIYHVSQLLGHSDTRITQRYAHLGKNNLSDVVALLNIE